MLNVGCGRRFHADWVNVDLMPVNESVQPCDISKGLPFDDNQFDAVYHSHVLEHFEQDAGRSLLRECLRVLKPGGVVRVVVPDLEQIASLYLQKHQQAWDGNGNPVDYQWMKLELLDQLVRSRSGGEMGRFIVEDSIEDKAFAKQRIGDEFNLCNHQDQSIEEPNSLLTRLGDDWSNFKNKMARRCVRWLLGRPAEAALKEALFRQQGEIHRWMYDRFSLRELFELSGFVDFQVKRADESQIDGFVDFQLDSFEGEVRKPDSIFVEATKAKQAATISRAANFSASSSPNREAVASLP